MSRLKAKKEDVIQAISDLCEDEKNVNLNLFKAKKKAKVNQEFVMIFTSKFMDTVAEFNIQMSDFLVLMKVAEYVRFGNVINLTQQTIADDLGIKQPQVARSFGKLERSGIFIRMNKSLFLHPDFICKGDLEKMTDSEVYKYALARKYNELKETMPHLTKEELDKKVHESMSFSSY